MNFKVGDSVVKPGIGICKIKAIRKLPIEGKEQSFYALQSGETNVMVPFEKAHKGAIRAPLNREEMDNILEFLKDPIRVPKDEYEDVELYPIDYNEANEAIKTWNTQKLAEIIKHLYYREKMPNSELATEEKAIYKSALNMLGEELAHLDRTIRPRSMQKIKQTIKEGRQIRKDVMYN